MPIPKRTRRTCPRGLYDGCPIPRELCTEDHARTGSWHCLELLEEFEWFVFPEEESASEAGDAAGAIESLEDLIRSLQRAGGT